MIEVTKKISFMIKVFVLWELSFLSRSICIYKNHGKKICLKTDFPEHSTDDLKLSMMIIFLHFVDCW